MIETKYIENKSKQWVLYVKISKKKHFDKQNSSKRSTLQVKISKTRHFAQNRLKVFRND